MLWSRLWAVSRYTLSFPPIPPPLRAAWSGWRLVRSGRRRARREGEKMGKKRRRETHSSKLPNTIPPISSARYEARSSRIFRIEGSSKWRHPQSTCPISHPSLSCYSGRRTAWALERGREVVQGRHVNESGERGRWMIRERRRNLCDAPS